MVKTLEEYRREKYMGVEEFAAFLGITPTTLYRIERGKPLRLSTLRKIADRLGVHPSDIQEFTKTESVDR